MDLGGFFSSFFKGHNKPITEAESVPLDEYTGNERNMATVTHLPA